MEQSGSDDYPVIRKCARAGGDAGHLPHAIGGMSQRLTGKEVKRFQRFMTQIPNCGPVWGTTAELRGPLAGVSFETLQAVLV